MAGNKLVFAGGSKTPDVFGPESSDEVDIYDAASGAWSVAHLPQPRAHHTASVVGNKIYIAGGVNQFISKSIDILDVTTNAWSTSLLSEPKSAHAAAVIDDKIYWIGGRTNAGPSTTIEIFNTSTQVTSFSQLPEVVETYLPALYRNGQLILFINIYGDPKAIILDINSGTWKEKHFVMPHYPSSFACLDNNIYMANGFNVWRVEL